jgi:hypothetical protein
MILSSRDCRKRTSSPTRTIDSSLHTKWSTHNRSTQTCLDTLSIANSLEATSYHDFHPCFSAEIRPTDYRHNDAAPLRLDYVSFPSWILSFIRKIRTYTALGGVTSRQPERCRLFFISRGLGPGALYSRESPFHYADPP